MTDINELRQTFQLPIMGLLKTDGTPFFATEEFVPIMEMLALVRPARQSPPTLIELYNNLLIGSSELDPYLAKKPIGGFSTTATMLEAIEAAYPVIVQKDGPSKFSFGANKPPSR